jgi:hypothetical protein
MSNQNNAWRTVPGFENLYEIHPDGIVRSLYPRTKGCEISKHICRGYVTVKLTRNKKGSTQNLHRLMALAFVPNPHNKPIVNHIDGDKLNYSLKNLEWVTYSENMKHAFDMKLASFASKPMINVCTRRRYNSMRAASKDSSFTYNVFKTLFNGSRRNPTCFRFLK